MNTYIWIAITLIAWTRPIDLYYKTTYTETINGRVVKRVEHDYVKYAAWLAAIVLVVVGLLG